MASKLDICNSALVKLGCMPLLALVDGSKEGTLTNARYDFCRDYVLREHPWKCAIKRVTLSFLYSPPDPVDGDGNPEFNPNRVPLSDPNTLTSWGFSAQMPSDFLRLVLTDDDKLPFQIEGNTILTNEQVLVIRYIWQVSNPLILDSHLAECIAWYLAQDLSMAIIQNTLVSDRMSKQYDKFLSKAKFIDAATSRAITQDEYYYENIRLQANHI